MVEELKILDYPADYRRGQAKKQMSSLTPEKPAPTLAFYGRPSGLSGFFHLLFSVMKSKVSLGGFLQIRPGTES
jgi:hypothetical protein